MFLVMYLLACGTRSQPASEAPSEQVGVTNVLPIVTAWLGGAVPLDGVSPPFPIQEDQVLEIPAAQTALVLYGGRVHRFAGPMRLSMKDVEGAAPVVAGASDRLERLVRPPLPDEVGGMGGPPDDSDAVSSPPAHATFLTRPAGEEILALREIRWSPSSERDIVVRASPCPASVTAGEGQAYDCLVWVGRGSGSVVYDGPRLAEGTYAWIFVGDEPMRGVQVRSEMAYPPFSVVVAAATEAARVVVPSGDEVAVPSALASVYVLADLPAEAVYAVDDALRRSPSNTELAQLLASVEPDEAGLAAAAEQRFRTWCDESADKPQTRHDPTNRQRHRGDPDDVYPRCVHAFPEARWCER